MNESTGFFYIYIFWQLKNIHTSNIFQAQLEKCTFMWTRVWCEMREISTVTLSNPEQQ